jgi:hypothetical protein
VCTLALRCSYGAESMRMNEVNSMVFMCIDHVLNYGKFGSMSFILPKVFGFYSCGTAIKSKFSVVFPHLQCSFSKYRNKYSTQPLNPSEHSLQSRCSPF